MFSKKRRVINNVNRRRRTSEGLHYADQRLHAINVVAARNPIVTALGVFFVTYIYCFESFKPNYESYAINSLFDIRGNTFDAFY